MLALVKKRSSSLAEEAASVVVIDEVPKAKSKKAKVEASWEEPAYADPSGWSGDWGEEWPPEWQPEGWGPELDYWGPPPDWWSSPDWGGAAWAGAAWDEWGPPDHWAPGTEGGDAAASTESWGGSAPSKPEKTKQKLEASEEAVPSKELRKKEEVVDKGKGGDAKGKAKGKGKGKGKGKWQLDTKQSFSGVVTRQDAATGHLYIDCPAILNVFGEEAMVPEDDNPMGARIGSIICFRLLPDQTSPTATGIVINGFEGEEEVRERITKPLATVGARDRPPLFVAPPPRASASIGQSSKGDKGGKGKKGFTTGEKGGKNGISWKGDKGGGKGQMGKGIRNKGNGSAPWSR